jgi:hypothetical protein
VTSTGLADRAKKLEPHELAVVNDWCGQGGEAETGPAKAEKGGARESR